MKGLFCTRSVFCPIIFFLAPLLFVYHRKYVFVRTAARWKYMNVGLIDFRNGTEGKRINKIEKCCRYFVLVCCHLRCKITLNLMRSDRILTTATTTPMATATKGREKKKGKVLHRLSFPSICI